MESFTLVIVGITSNLAQIKLIPTLYDLVAANQFNGGFSVVGVGRTEMDRNAFLEFISKTLRAPNRHHTHPIDEKVEKILLDNLSYMPMDLMDKNKYSELKTLVDAQNKKNKMFYLATFPSLYANIFENLYEAKLTESQEGWSRILIEKPIGSDRKSAETLNNLLTKYFKEDQIFRLDHYLGKETLQNILTFRFGNGLLEPLLNAEFIDHIQLTWAEDFGIGLRGSYFDTMGLVRDVGQNHILQMLALTTMDAPENFTEKEITTKRVELIKKIVPDTSSLVIGQYEGYKDEKNVEPNSKRETYFSFRAKIDKERFKDVPIYIRAGKFLTRNTAEVAIVFKNSDKRILSHLNWGLNPNALIFRIQPNEGIVLKIMTKKPGHDLVLEESFMQFCYKRNVDLPDAYERLIVDALKGDQTFFNDADEIDAQWGAIDPILKAMETMTPTVYPRGTWGPKEDNRYWSEPSVEFCTI